MAFTLPKDPRQSPEESASVLSSYFQDKSKKAQPYTYSAPVDAGAGTGSAPAAPTAAPSAPTGSTRGGSGFVNFGSYFGANAPSIQRESQKAAMGASSDQLAGMRGQGGNVGEGTQAPTFNQMLMGGTQRREAEQETARRMPFQQLRERMATGVTDPMQAERIAQAEKDRRKKAEQDDYEARMEAYRQGEGYAY